VSAGFDDVCAVGERSLTVTPSQVIESFKMASRDLRACS
jgi:hypothetical protein